MIHVLATITAKPGQRGAVLDRFRQVMPLVHAEPGCIQYEPFVDLPDAIAPQALVGPDTFIVIERWESTETLRTHIATAHMRKYNQDSAPLIASLVLHVLTPAPEV